MLLIFCNYDNLLDNYFVIMTTYWTIDGEDSSIGRKNNITFDFMKKINEEVHNYILTHINPFI